MALTSPVFLMPDPEWPASLPADSTPSGAVDESSDVESVRLMLRVKEGDVRAFERLVELHQRTIIGTVARMLNSVDDAHDVAQQVFIRIWRSAPRYEPSAKFTTWMFTITRNLVFNELRKRNRRKEVSIEQENEDEPPKQYASLTSPAPDEISQQTELENALDHAISMLPEKQRLAVVMRRYEDMPYEQICEVLGMSLPAVKSLLFRARAELRKHLASYLGEAAPE
jgi:RNA polymerase sigma-70 factor (ECF subfamily)